MNNAMSKHNYEHKIVVRNIKAVKSIGAYHKECETWRAGCKSKACNV